MGQLGFLSRLELYQTVKPYGLRYPPPDDLPQTNIVGCKYAVQVIDGRLRDIAFSDCGFCLCPFSTAMAYEAFSDPMKIKDIYCAEIVTAVKERLGASHVRVIDYSVGDASREPTEPCQELNRA